MFPFKSYQALKLLEFNELRNLLLGYSLFLSPTSKIFLSNQPLQLDFHSERNTFENGHIVWNLVNFDTVFERTSLSALWSSCPFIRQLMPRRFPEWIDKHVWSLIDQLKCEAHADNYKIESNQQWKGGGNERFCTHSINCCVHFL